MSAHTPTQDRVQGAPASLPTLADDIRLTRQVADLITGDGAELVRAAMHRVADAARGVDARPLRAGLSKAQRQVFNYVERFIQSQGYSPSLAEIADACGYSSLATVHEHVSNLEKKGYVRRDFNKSRSLEIVSAGGA